MRRIGIRTKLLASFIVMLFVAFGICEGTLTDRNFEVMLERSYSQALGENTLLRSDIEGRLVEELITKPGAAKTKHGLFSRTLSGTTDGAGLYFAVFGEGGELIYGDSCPLLSNAEFFSASLALSGLKEDETRQRAVSLGREEYYILTASPIKIDSEVLELLTVHDCTTVFTDRRSNVLTFETSAIVTSLVCTLIMLLFASLITRPLRNISDGVRELLAGDYSVRVPHEDDRDLGVISQGFNTAAEAVEENVRSIKEEAEKRSRFISYFSHEVKTPLASLVARADRIRTDRTVSERVALDANYICSECMRLKQLSVKLLELIRVQSEQTPLRPVSTVELFACVEESAGPILENSGMRLVINSDEYWINGDLALLSSAFINLIDNSRKASSVGSEIALSCCEQDGKIRLLITDYGRGMTPEEVEDIYKPFFSPSRARGEADSTGLGMSITNAIVARHNAVLEVESSPGQGTTVTLIFDKAQPPEEE